MDRIALAVAASFDPFPPDAPPSPPAPPMASPGTLAGQAVLVGPGLALTRADRSRCEAPEVDGMPASWMRQDPETGLALLGVPGHRDAGPVGLSPGTAAAEPRLALFLVPGDAAPTLSAAGATGDGPGRIRAPLQGAAAGALLIDGAGALAGMIGARDGKTVSIGGVLAAARYDLVDAARIGEFLRAAAVPTTSIESTSARTPLTLADAVARWRPATLPLRCHGM